MFKMLLKLSCAILLSVGVFFNVSAMDTCFNDDPFGDENARIYAEKCRKLWRNIGRLRTNLKPSIEFLRFLNTAVRDVKSKELGVRSYSNFEDFQNNECCNNHCSEEMKRWIEKDLFFDKHLPNYSSYVCGNTGYQNGDCRLCMAVDETGGFTNLFIETTNTSQKLKNTIDDFDDLRQKISYRDESFALREFFVPKFNAYPGCLILDRNGHHAVNCRGYFGFNPNIFDEGNEKELIEFVREKQDEVKDFTFWEALIALLKM